MDEQYIEHEVKLRVFEDRISALSRKYDWIIGTIVGTVIVPGALNYVSQLYHVIK